MVLLGTLEEEMRKRYRDDVQQTLSTHVLVLLQTLPSVSSTSHGSIFSRVTTAKIYAIIYFERVLLHY